LDLGTILPLATTLVVQDIKFSSAMFCALQHLEVSLAHHEFKLFRVCPIHLARKIVLLDLGLKMIVQLLAMADGESVIVMLFNTRLDRAVNALSLLRQLFPATPNHALLIVYYLTHSLLPFVPPQTRPSTHPLHVVLAALGLCNSLLHSHLLEVLSARHILLPCKLVGMTEGAPPMTVNYRNGPISEVVALVVVLVFNFNVDLFFEKPQMAEFLVHRSLSNVL
jgi:hypothetical protein